MKKLTVVLITVLSFMLLFVGCGDDTVSDMASDIKSDVNSTVSDIKDDMGSDLIGSNNMTGDSGSYSSNSTISKDEAKKIAFKHANIKEEDAYDIEISLDRDDGLDHYDIDFETKTDEYDYEINAKTGEIISSDKESKTNSR